MSVTRRQTEIYTYLVDNAGHFDHPPTYDELCEALGLASRGSLYKHIQALVQAGLVEPMDGSHRGIRLVEQVAAEPGIPLLGTIAAGRPIEAVLQPEYLQVPDELLGRYPCYVLQVSGDSMIEEGILDGDWVVVEQRDTARDGEIVVGDEVLGSLEVFSGVNACTQADIRSAELIAEALLERERVERSTRAAHRAAYQGTDGSYSQIAARKYFGARAADVELVDPVHALQLVSQDVGLGLPLELTNGRRMTALEMQWDELDRARKYGESVGFDQPMGESTCVACGECVQACPVGALVEKDARYQTRPWETQKVRTTCTYCVPPASRAWSMVEYTMRLTTP